MSDEKLIELEDRVAERRQEVEVRLARLRESLERETGFSPRRRGWLLALLAGSVGLAAALKLGKRREHRISDRTAKPAGRARRRRRRISPPRDA